jgi:transcriptional regulator with XRE-family HTH domain
MPRPSKQVPPNTLGGRIRAARQNLGLSLAEVAGGRYSTSLISQIERNRVDPSQDSLEYLANRLRLPLNELEMLEQRHRESEVESNKYKNYEEQRKAAAQLLASNAPRHALEELRHLTISQIPVYLRWRIIALRGECYFSLRKFLAAQKDFLSAVILLPEEIPQDQTLEILTLRLHLAAATRELAQLEDAYEYYQQALSLMNTSTPLRFIAETHWGLALVIFELAGRGTSNAKDNGTDPFKADKSYMQAALKHAESACTLYNSIGETLRAALLNCQIALIEQSLGKLSEANRRLSEVLEVWQPALNDSEISGHSSYPNTVDMNRYTPKERANLVSAAACYLAGIENEEGNSDKALEHIQLAIETGKKSYILRRAEAYMMQGQILAAKRPGDPEVERAFRAALNELEQTDRLAAKSRVHILLGNYLNKQGRGQEGEVELNEALKFSNAHVGISSATTADEDMQNNA